MLKIPKMLEAVVIAILAKMPAAKGKAKSKG
jgi:hypothetical protein